MNFSDQALSNGWAALTQMGEVVAEAWLEPEDEPLTLVFRVPRDRFEVPDLSQRKRLEELFRTHIEPRVPFPRVDEEREQLEHLQKDRQVLSAQGTTVYQECRGITSEVQRTLSTLQRNAADRARSKRSAGREKGKYF